MLRPHALREQTNFYRGAGLTRPLCSNSRADHQAVAVAPERRMWSVCGMGDTRLRWRDEVCCRREAAESERSIARILGIHHTAALGAADKWLLSPVKRRDQSIAPPSYPIGSRRNSVLSECSGYSSVSARKVGMTNGRIHPGRSVLLCRPRHTSTDE